MTAAELVGGYADGKLIEVADTIPAGVEMPYMVGVFPLQEIGRDLYELDVESYRAFAEARAALQRGEAAEPVRLRYRFYRSR
jgi:hypothetical protein